MSIQCMVPMLGQQKLPGFLNNIRQANALRLQTPLRSISIVKILNSTGDCNLNTISKIGELKCSGV